MTTFIPSAVLLYHGGLKALAIAEGVMRQEILLQSTEDSLFGLRMILYAPKLQYGGYDNLDFHQPFIPMSLHLD
jgi:hypothetical protein